MPGQHTLLLRSKKMKAKKRTFTKPVQRSTQTSRQNLVKMGSIEWPELLAFFLTLGSLIFNTTPTLPNHENYPYDDLNNWHDLYPDAHFEVPEDALLPKDKPVRVTIWVDADHARETCRSVSGIVIMVNSTVVRTFSKR